MRITRKVSISNTSPSGVKRKENHAMTEELKNEQQTNVDETNPTDESKNTEAQNVDNKIPYDRFKAKVDEANALKEKLAEFEKAQEEAKRKELEEQNEYKTLYEQALEQAAQAKAEAIGIKKNALLAQAGYSAEQTKLLSKLVDGETDEEISESIKRSEERRVGKESRR